MEGAEEEEEEEAEGKMFTLGKCLGNGRKRDLIRCHRSCPRISLNSPVEMLEKDILEMVSKSRASALS